MRQLRRAAKYVLYIGVIFGLAPTAIALFYFLISPSNSDGLDDLMRKMGFNPINPPSTIIGLGSIYRVSSDGREYQTLCPASADLLKDRIFESPSTRTVSDQLQQASYKLEGKIAEKVNSAVGTEGTDKLLEIPLSINRLIFSALVKNQDCRDEVDNELQHGELVCQGQTILAATAEYEVKSISNVSSDANTTKTAEALQKAVAGTTQTEVTRSGSKVTNGVSLHYGVKVNPLCVSPPHARFARILPRNQFHRIRYS